MLTRREIFTVPNLLTAARLVLALAFMAMIQRSDLQGGRAWFALILLAVLATDILDGKIARSTGRVTEIGKILDPVADKITQFVILTCMVPRYSVAKILLMLFFIKESYTLVLGWKYILDTDKNQMVRWHARLNTGVTYLTALILFAVPAVPLSTANILLGAVGICMLMSFVLYMDEFRLAQERSKQPVSKKIPGRVG